MKKKETIETQLDCKATALLQESVANDLKEKDRSLASLLNDEAEGKDDNETDPCD
jgi:hypothetical protein